mmetsp:Transcript_129/g.980  ORF Transcript_129/g.980 Transcript_129/m.980 type:complete len:387 (-) Transcript_129:993-2153(-)
MRIWLGLVAWIAGLHLCLGEESETCAAYGRNTQDKLTKEDILQRGSDHGDDVDVDKRQGKTVEGPVLGYVTPWNGKGYEVALKYRDKLTHVAPVWFQIMPGSPPTLQGRHDVDRGWMESLRKDRTHVPKIMPRFLFEGWSGEQFVHLLQSAAVRGSLAQKISDILVQECKQQELDGVVLEVWTQWWAWGLTRYPAAHRAIVSFIAQLYESLRDEGKLLALAVPPAVPAHAQYPAFSADDFHALKAHADLFSVMTYDASSSQQPGPNAPLGWVKNCVEELKAEPGHAEKVLVGLNFYGNDYGPAGVGRAILGHEFLSLLEEYPSSQLEWDENASEHVLTYHVGKVAHRVFYPTSQSLQQRIELARSHGTGLAIWELGQGLESFMDFL